MLRNLNIDLPSNPAMPLLEIYLNKMKSAYECYLYIQVHCSPSHNSQDMESTHMPINRWSNKANVIHTHYGILFSHSCAHTHTNNEIFCNQIYSAGNHYMLSDISQSKEIMYVFTDLWKLIHKVQKKKRDWDFVYSFCLSLEKHVFSHLLNSLPNSVRPVIVK